ncbi:MAG TPA: hypothetical protein VGQ53_03935 [Chitinophagaceae bacterium]|jgi:hypothetical protein|nr:hypothetical protein [Chitinophagaceae bacterium]
MKVQKSLFWLLLLTILVISCKKEHSYEKGITNPSSGSLQSGSTGDCLGSVVGGFYKVDTTLADSNYVDVKVDVTIAGDFTISTDTINGFYFSSAGSFTATGENTVRLHGTGTPQAVGTYIFTVAYDSSQCTFSVITLLGSGSGGTAVYTLQGAPGNCNPGSTQGTYLAGVATTSSNTATVNVDVTTVGTYSIVTTAVDGVTFSASGTFSGPGAQAIVLNATGTPAAEGSFTVPVTVGSTTCSFPLTVGSGAMDYFPRTTNSNWSYQFDGDPMDTLFQNVISQTQSALGNTYNVFMFNDGSGADTLGYYRKASGDYYQYLDVGFFFQLDHDIWGEYTFLKDNVAAGTSWNSGVFTDTYTDTTSGATVPISVRFKETIQQKDVAVTVQGTTYQNTIVVLEEYEYSFDGGATWSQLPFSSTNYYARNIGLVKLDFADNSGSGGSYLQELTRSQVF